MESVGVAFEYLLARAGGDGVFIQVEHPYAAKGAFPHAAAARGERVAFRVPAVKTAGDADARGVRRPDAENDAAVRLRMRAHKSVRVRAKAAAKQFDSFADIVRAGSVLPPPGIYIIFELLNIIPKTRA